MSKTEMIFAAVARVTGVSKNKMLSRSRSWPEVEARMLFVLLCASFGQDDQTTAWTLQRDRTTILNSRHKAEEYISISKSFKDKYNKIKEIYEAAKSV